MATGARSPRGVEPGDRVGDLGAEHRGVGHRRPRRLRRGRRARPAQHPLQGRGGGVHPRTSGAADAVHGHRLPRHQLRRAARRRRRTPIAASEIVVLRGDRAGRRIAMGRLPRPRRRSRRRGDGRRARIAALEPDDLSDILFTSGTTGRPRARCSRHGASVRAYDAWATRGRPARGRPLPHRQPVLPHVRAEGRHPRRASSRARRSCPHAGVRRADGACDARRRRSASRCSRARRRSTRRSSTTPTLGDVRPVVAAARGHRRGRRAGRDDPAHARGARVRDGRHRLRPDRDHRHRDDVPATTTRRDRSPTPSGRPIPGIEVRIVDDDGHRRRHRRARRGPGPRLQRDARLLRRPGGHRRGDRRRRLAAHRRHRRAWTSDGNLRITDRKKDMFIVGGFNAYPAEIENVLLRPPGGQPGRGGRRARRRAWARSACAFVVPRPGATRRPPTS